KADKLGRGQTAQTLLAVQRELAQLHGVLSVQVFSATAGTGVEAARGVLTRLLGGPPRAIIT
ncbi:MAG: YihA family ribosome biogenesis GTP-binding protein, partial [Proteobacteria bacterium]|nr:YihA family ribosome biogenesis GTP-binding protein [Pseudomonadota bacterium]